MSAVFSVGVNYWPRRSAMAMWQRFDAGEIGEDFARMRTFDFDVVRFFVRWDDFAPHIDALDSRMLDRLETVVTLAAEAGLRVIPALFCGHANEVNWLPAWALDAHAPAGPFPARVSGAYTRHGCGNLYAGPLLEAQLLLARAVAERLHGHPALAAWDLGNAFSNVREPRHAKVSSGDHSQAPADEGVVAAWSRRLTHALGGTPVTAGTHSGDLLTDRDIRLTSLCMPFAFASMQADTLTTWFARSRLDAEALPFLAMLTAAYSYKPVLVTGLGSPTCPPNRFSAVERYPLPGERPLPTISPDDPVFATYPCLTEDENAVYASAVLERLHADGRLGALWSSWTDYGDELAGEPPFDTAPHTRRCGLLRADGSAKSVATALAAFARQARPVARARDMPMIASAYYYRTLPTSTRTLFDAYLEFVRERRS